MEGLFMFAVKGVRRTSHLRAVPSIAVFLAILIVFGMRGKDTADRKARGQHFGLLCHSGQTAI